MAFDNLSHAGLISALTRLGLPTKYVTLIKDIYTNPTFTVRDNMHYSKTLPQGSGIRQGCPLSPFLFSILMTVMMHDCRMHSDDFANDMQELLYADDTLLIGSQPEQIQKYMNAVAEEGRRYGLILNLSKLEMMQINCDIIIRDAEGNAIQKKDSLKYLGALLHKSGE